MVLEGYVALGVFKLGVHFVAGGAGTAAAAGAGTAAVMGALAMKEAVKDGVKVVVNEVFRPVVKKVVTVVKTVCQKVLSFFGRGRKRGSLQVVPVAA